MVEYSVSKVGLKMLVGLALIPVLAMVVIVLNWPKVSVKPVTVRVSSACPNTVEYITEEH